MMDRVEILRQLLDEYAAEYEQVKAEFQSSVVKRLSPATLTNIGTIADEVMSAMGRVDVCYDTLDEMRIGKDFEQAVADASAALMQAYPYPAYEKGVQDAVSDMFDAMMGV